MYCIQCGGWVPEGSGACPSCGVPMDNPPVIRSRGSVALRAVAIVGTCLIVVATVFVIYRSLGSQSVGASGTNTESNTEQQKSTREADAVEVDPASETPDQKGEASQQEGQASQVADTSQEETMASLTTVPCVSACVARWQDVTYTLGPSADGLVELPTPCPIYDSIISFAFYNDKVYYCCADNGSIDVRLALCESNIDGSDLRQLRVPAVLDAMSGKFTIENNTLYFNEYSEPPYGDVSPHKMAIDLGSYECVEVGEFPDATQLFFDNGAFSIGDDQIFVVDYTNILVRHADGSTETLASEASLAGVAQDGQEGQVGLYYTTHSSDWHEYMLNRMDLSSRESIMLESHAGGQGGYFR